MTRTSRPLIWIALAVVLAAGACEPASPSQRAPATARPPTAGAATQPPATGEGGTFIASSVEAQTVQLETVPDPPEPADLPGAQGPEEEELNEGDSPPTPIHQGGVVEDAGGTPVTPVLPPAAQGQGTPLDLVLYGQPTTQTRGKRSQIAEPQVAAHGDRVLMTWNTQAAVSADRGASFDYFKLGSVGSFGTADGGYCCDQLAQYVPASDLWVWILQYWPATTAPGDNRIRIAVAKGDAAFDARRFSYWDLTAQMVGFPDGIWFDQPKIGISDRYLFLSMNAYTPRKPQIKPVFQAAVVFRIALEQLATGATIVPRAFTTAAQLDAYGLPLFGPMPARATKATMYLAAHFDNATLGIWRWPDDRDGPTFHRVTDVDAAGAAISYPVPYTIKDGKAVAVAFSCPRVGATDPIKSDWCNRSADRINSAWLGPSGLGFAWNVGQDAAHGWPYPSVWVELLDEAKIEGCESGACVLGHPSIRNAGYAFQYGTITPNARGDLGGVVLYGGGSEDLSCAVMVRDANTPANRYWDMIKVAASDVDPLDPVAGDYLGISTDGGSGMGWAAGCMTLRRALSSPTAVHFVRFGRQVDAPGP